MKITKTVEKFIRFSIIDKFMPAIEKAQMLDNQEQEKLDKIEKKINSEIHDAVKKLIDEKKVELAEKYGIDKGIIETNVSGYVYLQGTRYGDSPNSYSSKMYQPKSPIFRSDFDSWTFSKHAAFYAKQVDALTQKIILECELGDKTAQQLADMLDNITVIDEQ